MSRQEIYNLLVRAKRPLDFFGEVLNEGELKKKYLSFAKEIHPDTSSEREKYISTNGFMMLQNLYKQGQKELQDGIYNLVKAEDIYEKQEPLFSINIHGKDYSFYELVCEGEVADIYRGLCDKQLVYMKLCADPNDNDLLQNEYKTLSAYSHFSLPIVRDFIKVNDCSAIIMDEIKGMNLVDIMERHKKGLNPYVVMWSMERLFSVVGYLHSNYIVHGNIIPENIIINGDNHNVSLTGFSFHIPNANENDSHYNIKNLEFSAPEVGGKSKVVPQSDIYSLGKIAIFMLGGSVKTNGMPMTVDVRIREFIRKMVEPDFNKRSGDAWKLWDEWREIRKNVYGKLPFSPENF